MKKLGLILLIAPFLILGQEISIYGNHGMFKMQYAQPHNMGMFSFHMALQERFESFNVQVSGQTTTDRRHYFSLTSGLSYAITDYLEARFHATPFLKWYEANDYPEERGDPYPPIGVKDLEIGAKGGYLFVIDEQTPMSYALGVDGYIRFGPGLSKDFFSNAWHNDSAFYVDSFYGIAPHFPPHIPHDPDYGFTGLFDFRIGPFATHLNIGYLSTGRDINPGYVLYSDMHQRPDYVTNAIGLELLPSEEIRILFEACGMFDTDASQESLWVTPGLRFGARSVSFDLGCELGILNPDVNTEFWWKAFINFSAGADLIKKVEVHIPVAKISGKVIDSKTEDPIVATITFPGSDKESIKTSADGYYETTFFPGTYRLHFAAPNYRWKERGVVLKDGDQIVMDIKLNRKLVTKIIGKVYDIDTKEPLVAQITFPQTKFKPIATDTAGLYSVTLAPGTFRIHVEATNYQFDEKVITLKSGESKVVDIGLKKLGIAQAVLTGKISEAETGKPLLAQVTFVDTKIPVVTTDPSTGIYKVTVPPGTYSLKVTAENYVPESTPIVLEKDETKIQNFTLKPIPKVGERIILKGIYFDFNSAVIKPESYPVLDDAAKVLKAKPNMKVEIGGHTDSIGSDSYNMKLSYQRANAVRDYLIRYHNIDPSRLIAVGYGETRPIADNRTRAGRDLNRRIEFKILSW